MTKTTTICGAMAVTLTLSMTTGSVNARLADRSRVSRVMGRRNGYKASKIAKSSAAGHASALPFEQVERALPVNFHKYGAIGSTYTSSDADQSSSGNNLRGGMTEAGRSLASQLSGCCYNYQSYDAASMCALYGQDCESGETPSHDSGDDSCEQAGLSFIGVSFSVNTKNGNPYSYHICEQFYMENIIDRDYEYVMSMDEDGWLVGGGYKTFDYSGKMPYIDSSHTELLRIGSLDPEMGGTSIDQVYTAMEYLYIPPLSIFPEYVKGGGGHNSGDNDKGVPSSDVTMIVSVVDSYTNDDSYSEYEKFLDDLFDAMDAVGGGPCMDDHDTDPHVSMARGVKFKSSYHSQQYFYKANLEVAVWQAMYPKGVVIGSAKSGVFPINSRSSKSTIGYGNLYFFFDRANMTKSFLPSRDLTTSESYYSTLMENGGGDSFYQSVTSVDFNYQGSHDSGGDEEYEHNPYSWNAKMAKHDMTDGWDLPPNCEQEGETFFGIPLSRKSDSILQSSSTFQEQFDFEALIDRNFTYIKKFGTNHGWLVGEILDNGAGSIVDKDTAHIPIFYVGTTNPDMGGMALSDMIKVGKSIDFGKLYIKPSFLFVDDDGAVKLQFEADPNSALGYLYDNLCKMIGISWNYKNPSNDLGTYTSCAMHAAGDRATYGCGPENSGTGGFCPQMTLAYRVGFQSEEHAAAYLAAGNNYIDYWRSLYPNGVAVGASKFCPEGGCLALFLNRYDLYYVFKPDLGGSWVEYNGGTMAPTTSPAPTWRGGCDDIRNHHLDKCVRKRYARSNRAVFWDSLGAIGQFSLLLMAFMAITLTVSVFVARAKKRKRRNETYVDFFMRDLRGGSSGKKKKLVKKKKKRIKRSSLKEKLVDDYEDDLGYSNPTVPPPRPGRKSRTKSERSRSKSKSRSSNSSRVSGRSRSRSRSKSRRSLRTDGSAAGDTTIASEGVTSEREGGTRRQLV
uniref:Uncharacterized protein n=1 Tax=Leptocylindrus danicus TaxID=163516 RepID=A0A7S2KSQ7_9STRA|mmetsp:Transcript_25468/g.38030  ORF Transcript_25468/g.38030 Transcript_25468/m.38030 type:complete len:956 (+) Transcript_25468:231-3098(+)|eukprot:CAMPEP_0116014644 /NCGR_PEP_ID=MMETSP0321-20121206/6380_1 /TAXON_ID=163516 /ORGANISM="Leptocylindrus danicus var. danicus, Strain B650" /LENGTH=955 /DNA_ID=CAMNT_0003484295 /DNA_START=230 /DNA_END=3097 /DNA_ORIENTATION=+